ncbi:hypothetical protein ACVMHY_006435 [Bradyrhizobium barranii subsp. barranii]
MTANRRASTQRALSVRLQSLHRDESFGQALNNRIVVTNGRRCHRARCSHGRALPRDFDAQPAGVARRITRAYAGAAPWLPSDRNDQTEPLEGNRRCVKGGQIVPARNGGRRDNLRKRRDRGHCDGRAEICFVRGDGRLGVAMLRLSRRYWLRHDLTLARIIPTMTPHSGEAHRSKSKVASYGPIASEEAQNQETSGSPSSTCRHRRSDASCHRFKRDAARYPATRDVSMCRFDRSITKRPSGPPSF